MVTHHYNEHIFMNFVASYKRDPMYCLFHRHHMPETDDENEWKVSEVKRVTAAADRAAGEATPGGVTDSPNERGRRRKEREKEKRRKERIVMQMGNERLILGTFI